MNWLVPIGAVNTEFRWCLMPWKQGVAAGLQPCAFNSSGAVQLLSLSEVPSNTSPSVKAENMRKLKMLKIDHFLGNLGLRLNGIPWSLVEKYRYLTPHESAQLAKDHKFKVRLKFC